MIGRARGLAMGGVALFLILTLAAVFSHAVEYDEGYNASVAKALAMGAGYVTAFHVVIPFNPEITTGPTILLPMAGLIAVFGNASWVPGLATWIVSALALAALADGLARSMEASGTPPGLAGFAIWPFLLAIWLFGAMGFVSVGIGEAPAVLLLLLAIVPLAAALEGGRAGQAAWGGLTIGLAILTKLIMLLPAAGLLSVFALGAVARWGWRRAAGLAVLAGVGSVLPTLVFLLVRAPHVVPAQEAGFMSAAGGGFAVLGAGAEMLRAAITARLAGNGAILSHWMGGAVGLALAGASLALGLGLAVRTRSEPGSALRLLALAGLPAGAAVLALWWLPLGSSMLLRHGLPAILLALFAICLLPALAPRDWRAPAGLATLAVLAWLGITREARLEGVPPGYHPRTFEGEETIAATSRLLLRPVARLAEQREAAEAVATFRAANPEVRLMGISWWVPRELDYLLPEVLNFHDVLRSPEDGRPRAVVISEAYWNWGRDPAMEEIRARCGTVVFRNRSYSLLRCP